MIRIALAVATVLAVIAVAVGIGLAVAVADFKADCQQAAGTVTTETWHGIPVTSTCRY